MNPNESNGSLSSGSSGGGTIHAYLDKFVDIAFNAVIGFDSGERITFWNPAAEQLYGWTASEVLGKTSAELFEPGSIPEDQENQRQRLINLERGAIVWGEYRPCRKDGSLVSIEYKARAIFNEDGGFSGYLAVHRDITERKQAIEEISRLNAELQTQLDENKSLMDILPIGIWIGNHDCSVITGNPAAYRTMGITPGINVSLSNPEPEMPLGLRIFVDGVEVAPEDAPMQTVARTGKPMYNFEHEFLFPDQTRKTFYVSIAPVFDKQGAVRKVIAAYADFTERKQAEEQLRLAREYAEQTAGRIIRLQKVTAALSGALTPAQVAEVVVDQGAPALGAVSGTMMLLTEDGQSLEMVQSAAPEALVRPYRRFSLSLPAPAADAVRSGQPVWLESRQQYLERYPHLSEQIIAWGNQAAVAIPMVDKGRTLGVLTLSFDHILASIPENLGFALTLARQGAQALERARLYQAEQQALSELQMTYDQSPIGMVQLDTDLRYIRVNKTLALMNGIPADEHIGKSIHEIVPNLAPKIEGLFRSVMETGQPVYNIEAVGETKVEPGMPHTWLESCYPLRDKDGKVVGLNVVIQDITNRKRDEHALAEFARQQEALYKLADKLHRTSSLKGTFDAALDAILNASQCDRASILLFDVSGVMRFVAWRGLSTAYRKATEGHSPWRPDEKEPEPIYFPDIDATELDDTLKVVIKAEGIDSLAFIPLVFDGKLLGKFMMYFNTPHTFSANEIDLSVTIAHQLAFGIQRTRAEDALRESEERFRSMADAAPVMIWISGTDKLCTWFNKTWLDFAGRTMEEELGNGWTKNIHPDDLDRCLRIYTTSFDTRRPFIMEYRVKRKDGEYRWVLDTGIPLYGPSNEFTGYIGSCLDFTERKHAEQVLRKSEEQLQTLNETLERRVREKTAEAHKLASDLTKAEQRERHRIAHILHEDLQQRIYAIQMQVEFLLDGLKKDNVALQRDFVKIRKQLNEVVAIMRQLSVDISPPILSDEGLTQTIEWLASQIQEQHGLRIEFQAEGSFALPDEDIQMLLFSCVRELLFNVVKHSGVNRAVVALQKSNGDLRIEIRDEGKGFDVDGLAWLASNNEDEDELQYRSYGLPTLRHRLSLFGGQMDIQSEKGAGTLVTITIPVSK